MHEIWFMAYENVKKTVPNKELKSAEVTKHYQCNLNVLKMIRIRILTKSKDPQLSA